MGDGRLNPAPGSGAKFLLHLEESWGIINL